MRLGFERAGRLLCALGILILMPGPTRAAVLPNARPLVERLERAVGPLSAFDAEFVQIRHLSLTDENVEAGGRLRFLAPSNFRLDFRSPDPDVLVLSGDSMIVYMAGQKQARRYEVAKDDATRDLFLLFSSRKGELGGKFDVSLAPPSPEGQGLRLQPIEDTEESPLSEILVYLNAKTSLPERLFFREEGGDTVVFKLSKPRTNRKLTAADFDFVPPRGTEIIGP